MLQIYTDANSCYDLAFKRMGIEEQHFMTKSQTHLIESSNSSIRDNLARFNRKTKRYSKSFEMLKISLDLFFLQRFYFIGKEMLTMPTQGGGGRCLL